ncbi:NAD(P)/FAD-dependent oxidoreductase [bacterium]|nr:NAD(P)/FAD-dependent oxidoreductase [bacterium]
MEFDAIVVGAGPAGALSAMLLARQGHRVLLLDKARFPRDKICGGALSPAAIPILERIGAWSRLSASALRLEGIRLVSPEGRACEGRYPGTEGVPPFGLSIARLSFDDVLVQLAQLEPSLQFTDGTMVHELLWQGDRCVGVRTAEGPLRARAVVLAEGRFSRLHPALLRRSRGRKRRVFVAAFEGVEGLDTLLELIVPRARRQLVLNPQGPTRAAIALVSTEGDPPHFGPAAVEGYLRLLREEPALRGRLERAVPLGVLHGLSLEPYAGEVLPADGLVVVGDNVRYFDPLTGQGMYRALRSAELASDLLGAALREGLPTRQRLAPYGRQLAREFRWAYRFSEAVASLSQSETVMNLAVRALAAQRGLADRMAAYQGAVLPPQRFFLDLVRLAAPALPKQ